MQTDGIVSPLERVLRLHGDFRTCLRPLRITPLQAAVLLYVQRNKGSGGIHIAKALRMQHPTIVPVIGGLVVRDLIRKLQGGEDKRVKGLHLTAKGHTLLSKISRRLEEMNT